MGALSTAQLLITANQWRVRKKKNNHICAAGIGNRRNY